MEMVEKVARAIAMDRAEPWDHMSDDDRASWVETARAALEAMREPTKPMIFCGMDAMCRDDLEPTEDEFRRGFQGAIDAALSPSGEKR